MLFERIIDQIGKKSIKVNDLIGKNIKIGNNSLNVQHHKDINYNK